ncbi:MAG: bifunctional oligoribonuclease/PAP phosphatase NrnA [Muribaculaceae bacterium]|nr:bifunctional oligoribonuclease/PAP phosphatase NrnA [Muribaculaceae bacterium]MDE6347031.1 bifunctional oligoribonuclease/PAP phosphatase NrnA [Muribaculaceae bacterium]
MLSRLVDEKNIKELRKLLENCEKIVITCHIAPDGDAIGSSLGLANVLGAVGKTVKVITPDMPPRNLMFLPGAKDIVVYTKYTEFAENLLRDADLIFALDYNDIKRIDRVADAFAASRASKVMIDHHLFPGDFVDVKISHPEVSSTSMLIFRVLCRLELFPYIDKDAAACIYTGMMTDTGNFSYNSNDPDLYIVISELLKKGINKDAIYSKVYNSNTPDRLRLNGYAINQKMKIYDEYHGALITLTRDELNSYHYQKGDTESLVNTPLSVPDIVFSFFLREESDYIKVSARSKGDFPVNKLCEEHFNGGGHKNAAGGEFYGTMEEAVARFEEIMPQCRAFLESQK